ncbi:hypothetical protein EKO27_g8710 [Xylaria grammica]|uniref:Uncharacterized protein n=1 Tax=Xylaria grammica TaxID=363999 RepID=A0A439CW13_9PEZI|nr:hypothetical protein EKO27_g8710 [Xylaria grammica]
MADTTNHSELIIALQELYTLLADLGAVPAESVRLPDPNTGTHPAGAINTEAAEAAGYAPETVTLMTALPYLAVAGGYKLGTGHLLDIDSLPPTALRLTKFDRGGVMFIYDTATKLVYPFIPYDNNPDYVHDPYDFHNPYNPDDYSHVTGVPRREAFLPIVEDYRKLRHLSGGVMPADLDPDEQKIWEASYAAWEAIEKVRVLYLECGWDMHAVKQTRFRLGELRARRYAYWRDVVEPLLLAVYKLDVSLDESLAECLVVDVGPPKQ